MEESEFDLQIDDLLSEYISEDLSQLVDNIERTAEGDQPAIPSTIPDVANTPPIPHPQVSPVSRFDSIDPTSFLQEQENQMTIKRQQAVGEEFKNYLQMNDFSDPPESYAPDVLDPLIGKFIISVRKKNSATNAPTSDREYEPSTLDNKYSFLRSYLLRNGYGIDIRQDARFTNSQKLFRAKLKDLKKKGLGNRPNASDSVTIDEFAKLYDDKEIGIHSPLALMIAGPEKVPLKGLFRMYTIL